MYEIQNILRYSIHKDRWVDPDHGVDGAVSPCEQGRILLQWLPACSPACERTQRGIRNETHCVIGSMDLLSRGYGVRPTDFFLSSDCRWPRSWRRDALAYNDIPQ